MNRKEGSPNSPYHPEYNSGPDPYAGLNGEKPTQVELAEPKEETRNSAAESDYGWRKNW